MVETLRYKLAADVVRPHGGAVGGDTALQIGTGCSRATWWRSWLRHYATNLKVAGSISDGVIGIIFPVALLP